ncbi:MAG: dCTP deaminase [Candidatus Woesearchaeota archaeon]|jgi:dCTP deaminase|nr:dCTP deaminase [Candidatus Woesearchaeota archaeon]MDP7199069.1 dCTP deaminase [Candidatus Woesearchaeota archaeon]MDP7467779.1 dCTP deaminase [Candidatus Woesearchaeota archaeon]MDP7646482.1 dCTP deaminase [Candidatus Woesearchaeota archaeon]
MVLTRPELLKAIKKGQIRITPFDKNAVGPGSIDLTLDKHFRVFTKSKKQYVADEKANYHDVTKAKTADHIIIKPGEMVLGITKEKVTLQTGFSGWLEGRSRFARLGLLVHISASFMQPGIDNKQVLEMVNLGKVPLKLKQGTKVCQLIVQPAKGRAKYEGKFSSQQKP